MQHKWPDLRWKPLRQHIRSSCLVEWVASRSEQAFTVDRSRLVSWAQKSRDTAFLATLYEYPCPNPLFPFASAFHYTLSDTPFVFLQVNTASRMESTGVVDRIQMSKAAAQLVKEQAPELINRVHSRAGLITPKGKTPMQTFWLFTDEDMDQVRTRGRLVQRGSANGLSQVAEGIETDRKRRLSDGLPRVPEGLPEEKRRRSDGLTKSGSEMV